jgi:hypothetical protein
MHNDALKQALLPVFAKIRITVEQVILIVSTVFIIALPYSFLFYKGAHDFINLYYISNFSFALTILLGIAGMEIDSLYLIRIAANLRITLIKNVSIFILVLSRLLFLTGFIFSALIFFKLTN